MFPFFAMMGLQNPMQLAIMMAQNNITPMAMQSAMSTQTPQIGQMAQPMPLAQGMNPAMTGNSLMTGGNIPMPSQHESMVASMMPPDPKTMSPEVSDVKVAAMDPSIYSEFMGTVKSKITNPNALAAVASTGMRESGFSRGNAFRTWSDPSESGAAGTAGGILSWRGGRLSALQSFARKFGEEGRISPATQARFFLEENPSLIDSLNAAKSPEEAQRLMNNAWRFAGFNRAGGEAGARISLAKKIAAGGGLGDIQAPGSTSNPIPAGMTGSSEVDKQAMDNLAAQAPFTIGDVGNIAATGAASAAGETAALTAANTDPPASSFADKLAAIGKNLKIAEGTGGPDQIRPTGGLAPQVGGGFSRNPQSMEILLALLGGGGAPPQLPPLSQLIRG